MFWCVGGQASLLFSPPSLSFSALESRKSSLTLPTPTSLTAPTTSGALTVSAPITQRVPFFYCETQFSNICCHKIQFCWPKLGILRSLNGRLAHNHVIWCLLHHPTRPCQINEQIYALGRNSDSLVEGPKGATTNATVRTHLQF